jgi:pyruvate dehydrogenase E1 component
VTIYDFFIKRLPRSALMTTVYWHSHFATLGTPSGVTLAPEGAQHSWKQRFPDAQLHYVGAVLR